MNQAAIYTSLALTVIYAISFLVALLARVRQRVVNEKTAKSIYSVAVVIIGIISGAAFFPALLWLYAWLGHPQPTGHGEVIVAALSLNFVLAVVLTLVGRVILGWRPMQW